MTALILLLLLTAFALFAVAVVWRSQEPRWRLMRFALGAAVAAALLGVTRR